MKLTEEQAALVEYFSGIRDRATARLTELDREAQLVSSQKHSSEVALRALVKAWAGKEGAVLDTSTMTITLPEEGDDGLA